MKDIITRADFLKNKSSLSYIDLINIIDLPAEKTDFSLLKAFTDKSFKELKDYPEKLSALTSSLIQEPEYLKFYNSFISKSKLLFEDSNVLCNELPCLIILSAINQNAYLLPYRYAFDINKDEKKFADALTTNFTDFKRVFSSSIRMAFQKGIKQSKNIFFLVNNDDISISDIKDQLKILNNYRKSNDKSGTYYFFLEKDFICYVFNVNEKGLVSNPNLFDLKKFRPDLSIKPLSRNPGSYPLSHNENITPNNSAVKEKSFDLKKIRLDLSIKPLPRNPGSYPLSHNENITPNNSAVKEKSFDLKKFRPDLSVKPLSPNPGSYPLSSNISITSNNSVVKDVFSSLLLRGEILELKSQKDISNRFERYFNAVRKLTKLNKSITSDVIVNSNNNFLISEKSSPFFKYVKNILQPDSKNINLENAVFKSASVEIDGKFVRCDKGLLQAFKDVYKKAKNLEIENINLKKSKIHNISKSIFRDDDSFSY